MRRLSPVAPRGRFVEVYSYPLPDGLGLGRHSALYARSTRGHWYRLDGDQWRSVAPYVAGKLEALRAG